MRAEGRRCCAPATFAICVQDGGADATRSGDASFIIKGNNRVCVNLRQIFA